MRNDVYIPKAESPVSYTHLDVYKRQPFKETVDMVLELTGETKPEDIPKSDVVPDAVFTGLKEMGELLGEK